MGVWEEERRKTRFLRRVPRTFVRIFVFIYIFIYYKIITHATYNKEKKIVYMCRIKKLVILEKLVHYEHDSYT